MPIVTIQITKERNTDGTSALTPEMKAALISGATELMCDVLNKDADSTFVLITEVESGNWGWGGLPIEKYRDIKSGYRSNDEPMPANRR